MATFTTWTALKTTMLDDLASNSWRTAEYTVAGRQVKYRTFAEFKEALEYVTYMADQESGTVAGRTYARPRES